MRPATAWTALVLAGALALGPGAAGLPAEPDPGDGGETAPTTAPTGPGAAPAPETAEEAPPAEDHRAADLYLSRCAGCHTIGGGELSGPDLLASTAWPREDLAQAVERMEKNAGPMTDEQVTMLVDLLKAQDVQQRLAAAREARVEEMAATLEPPSPARGGALFHGGERFRNGGLACSACHRAGDAGGTLAADLTDAAERLGESALLSAAESPGFPLMKAAYADHPVSRQEAVHLTAYLQELAPEAPGPAAADPSARYVGAWGGAAAVAFLLALTFLYRGRVRGVRAPLVRAATRR